MLKGLVCKSFQHPLLSALINLIAEYNIWMSVKTSPCVAVVLVWFGFFPFAVSEEAEGLIG